MSYGDLSLKYRPRKLEDVMQPHVVRALSNSIGSGRLSHCYLFSGQQGTGKTSVARLIAAEGACEDPSDEGYPCGLCPNCSGVIEMGSHMDVTEINAAQETGKDDMWTRVAKTMNRHPVRFRKKTYILDECHSLSRSAQNSLLKILEEPPAYARFVLCTTEPSKLLNTIVDRSIHFEFPMIQPTKIAERLGHICGEEGIDAEKEALRIIARESRGSMRRALKMLEKIGTDKITTSDTEVILGRSSSTASIDLLELIVARDRFACLRMIDTLCNGGMDVLHLFGETLSCLMDMLRIKAYRGTDQLEWRNEEEIDRLKSITKTMSGFGGVGRQIDILSRSIGIGISRMNSAVIPTPLMATLSVVDTIHEYENSLLLIASEEGGDKQKDAIVSPKVEENGRQGQTGG